MPPESPSTSGPDPQTDSIVARLSPELSSLVRRFMGGAVQVIVSPEDVAQQVWTKFLKALETFRPASANPEADLRGLLSTIARNVVIDWARKLDTFVPAVEHAVFDAVAADGGTPSRIVAQDQALAHVRDSLPKLTTVNRDILWRRYFLGQTIAQIAGDLDLTEGQVLHRHRETLRELRSVLGSSGNYRFDFNGR